MTPQDLFIGITSWNSSFFLPTCLDSIRRTTDESTTTIRVLDNCSTDSSPQIIRDYGCELIKASCNQREALSTLIDSADSHYTLLIHADIVLLNPDWFDLCRSKIGGRIAMVSPEDIGCGPMTRPFGVGMPESSFMFFNTKAMKRCRQWAKQKRGGIPLPRRSFLFTGKHLTHDLPSLLKSRGFSWFPMQVFASNREKEPLFSPPYQPAIWSDELSYLRYGLGNFYGVDDQITHYHNWYDRIIATNHHGAVANQGMNKQFPEDFIRQYSTRFLADYKNGVVDLPKDLSVRRQPRAI